MRSIIYNINKINLVIQGCGVDMTEKEAINVLLDNYPPKEKESLQKAFDLAIDALRVINAIPDKHQ